MSLHVIDASAWLRLFLHDGPPLPALELAAHDVERGVAAFVAPELILVEAGHALLRKFRRKKLRDAEWRGIWKDMRCMPIDLIPCHERMDEAIALAVSHDLSVYDALYLATAVHVGAVLHSGDESLNAAARGAGVQPRPDGR